MFGGDVFLVNLLGISVLRELGPLLAAILVAGRSGSSMTAQLGVMRVTEELSAMQVMGLPQGFRLIMPKVIALSIVMPLLVIWTLSLIHIYKHPAWRSSRTAIRLHTCCPTAALPVK